MSVVMNGRAETSYSCIHKHNKLCGCQHSSLKGRWSDLTVRCGTSDVLVSRKAIAKQAVIETDHW